MLTKGKYFFVYQHRKKGLITKYAYITMIFYYVINASLTALLIYFLWNYDIYDSSAPRIFSACMFLNVGLFIVSVLQPILNEEQREKLDEQQRRIEAEKRLSKKRGI